MFFNNKIAVFMRLVAFCKRLIRKYNDKVKHMTTKQRAYLKGLAMNIDPIYNIGKASITPEFTIGISEALEARELIKVSVLKNCADDPYELAQILAERTKSEVVQVIGKKIVLYKRAKENQKITLPREKKKISDY